MYSKSHFAWTLPWPAAQAAQTAPLHIHWDVLVSGAQAMRCCRPKAGGANTVLCSMRCWDASQLANMLMLRSLKRS